jgi:hypothetical protein
MNAASTPDEQAGHDAEFGSALAQPPETGD